MRPTLLASALLALAAGAAAKESAILTIVESTDIHSNIWSYDYFANEEDDTIGYTRVASLIREARESADNVLYFDNGDVLQGSPLSDYIAERGINDTEEGIHPMIAALNVMEPDCGTLGNHEFNYGVDFLKTAMGQANFPIVCCNVVNGPELEDPLTDDLLFDPYIILNRTIISDSGEEIPIKIGVIGWVPSRIMQWDKTHLEGKYNAWGIGHAAKAWVPIMKEEGADVIVALSHSGIKEEPDDPDNWEDEEMNSLFTAQHVEGIDVMLTGHAHLKLPGSDYEGIDDVETEDGKASLAGVPATMPGYWGSHMGKIELELEYDDDKWSVKGFTSTIIPISETDEDGNVTAVVEEDEEVKNATRQAHEETLEYVNTPVGETSARIYSYFATVRDDPSVQIVNEAMMWYIEPMIGEEGLEDGIPLLSSAAPFRAGGRGGPSYYTDIPEGPITIANVADLYLYPNTVMVVKINGTCVKGWLEQSGMMFNKIDPDSEEEQQLLDREYPTYNFDVIDGCNYTYDVTQEGGKRLTSLECGGHDLMEDDDVEFLVITNNYRAEGNDFNCLGGETIVFKAPDTARDVLTRYIIELGTVDPAADGNWHIDAIPGANVVFESSPEAKEIADEVDDVAYVGKGEDGFDLFKMVFEEAEEGDEDDAGSGQDNEEKEDEEDEEEEEEEEDEEEEEEN